jgi:hypothetical protein
MAAPFKQYFLAPNFDYPPDGPIQLGRVYASPTKLAEALNPLADDLEEIIGKFVTSKKNFKTTCRILETVLSN